MVCIMKRKSPVALSLKPSFVAPLPNPAANQAHRLSKKMSFLQVESNTPTN
jgi:hypothetical protein